MSLDKHLTSTSCERNRERGWKIYMHSYNVSGKCSFVCYYAVKAIIRPLRNHGISADSRRDFDAPATAAFVSARKTIIRSCNLCRQMTAICARSDLWNSSLLLFSATSTSDPPRPARLPLRLGTRLRPVHSHAEKCKTPGGNERFVIGRR